MSSLPAVLTPNHPDFQAIVAAAFRPEDRKVACEIPQKGTDGSGWIGGKLFDRKTMSAGCCMFQMSVERANRVNVFISAELSKYVDALPLGLGGEVRIAARGLELEDITEAKLVLRKRFVWREGLVMYAKSKTGEEGFVDTFTGEWLDL